LKKAFIKFKSWEFWPIWLVYLPVFFSWIFYAIRLKSIFFFTNVNPKIEMGGFAGESKMGILNQIPKQYLPTTLFVKENTPFQNVLKQITELKIEFPCIAKPDIGERGLDVQICKSIKDLEKYHTKAPLDYIIQNFIDYPIELAILYYRFPNQKKGKITSICQKDFLSVLGNGKDNIKTLMQQNDRAILQLDRFEKEKTALLKRVLKKGEKLVLEPIGNHSRGTLFLDKNECIDNEIIEAFDVLSKQIPELYFGRYDLKCNSIKELKKLQNFSIIEINGVSAEPAHIYQPGFSFFKAQKILLKQWNVLYQISKQQKKLGKQPLNFKCAIHHLKQYKKKINLHHN